MINLSIYELRDYILLSIQRSMIIYVEIVSQRNSEVAKEKDSKFSLPFDF